MARPLRRTLGAVSWAAFAALFAFAAAGLAGACNPGAYDDYELGPFGAAAGPGGPAAAECNGFFSNDPSCQGCFAGSSCCSLAALCDDECKGYIGCVNQCTGSAVSDCLVSCKERFPFGPDPVERLLDCLSSDCSQCGGLRLGDGNSIGGPQGAGGGGAGGGGPSQRCQEANACAVYATCKDCDQDGTSSCETDVSVNRENCGACGRNCLNTACVDGQCLSVSAANNLFAATRLAAGGGYLYWVSTKDQIDTLPGDALYRVNVANNGQPEPTYIPAGALTIFDFAVDATGFYLVTDQGIMMREHASAQPPVALAAAQNGALADPTAPERARIGASSGQVFFTTPVGAGDGTQLWAAPKAAGATATPIESFASAQISMLVGSEGGVFVGSSDEFDDAGLWYVPNGGAKSSVFGGEVDEFAVSGLDVILLNEVTFDAKLLATSRSEGSSVPAPTELLAEPYSLNLRALAADESGLYYLARQPSGGDVSLMRLRRESGATGFGTPATLLSNVPSAKLDLPLALDANWIYGVASSGNSIWRVPK